MSFWKINMLIMANVAQYPVVGPYKYVFTRGIPTISSCSLIIPEMYPVDNILYAFFLLHRFLACLFHHVQSHCYGCSVINAWHNLGSWSRMSQEAYGNSSCNFWQLNKGHIPETSLQATYTGVIWGIVGALRFTEVHASQGLFWTYFVKKITFS